VDGDSGEGGEGGEGGEARRNHLLVLNGSFRIHLVSLVSLYFLISQTFSLYFSLYLLEFS